MFGAVLCCDVMLVNWCEALERDSGACFRKGTAAGFGLDFDLDFGVDQRDES